MAIRPASRISNAHLTEEERWEGIDGEMREALYAIAQTPTDKSIEEQIGEIFTTINQPGYNSLARAKIGIELEGAITARQLGTPKRYDGKLAN